MGSSLEVAHLVGEVPITDQKKVIDALEGNEKRISAHLKATPVQPFEVYLYSGRWADARATGNWGASGSVEGPGKLQMLPWSRDGAQAETVAVPEFTHAMVLKLLGDHAPQPFDPVAFDARIKRFPVWLWEAIAAYESAMGKQLPPGKASYRPKAGAWC